MTSPPPEALAPGALAPGARSGAAIPSPQGGREEAPGERRRPILVLHGSDAAYGSDRILLHVVAAARSDGREPVVLLPDDEPPGWLTDRLREYGVRVERAFLAPARRRYLRPRYLPRYLFDLVRARRGVLRFARDLGAGTVHVNTTVLLVGALLRAGSRIPVVWHVHEIVERPRLLAWLFRLLPLLTVDRVIVVSAAVRDHLTPRGVGRRRRVRVIHNGLPHRPPSPDPVAAALPAPRVAFVGRLNRWKGYEVFVEAVGRVAPAHPRATFLVAGDPPPGEVWREQDLRDRIRAAGVEERVVVLGFHPDVPALLDAVQIAVVPSTLPDPLPTVVLEAMRAGCAVIGTNHGGIPEMLNGGRCGILVPPGDAVAVADALDTLLRDPERVRALGAAARDRVATAFTPERFRAAVTGVWRSLS